MRRWIRYWSNQIHHPQSFTQTAKYKTYKICHTWYSDSCLLSKTQLYIKIKFPFPNLFAEQPDWSQLVPDSPFHPHNSQIMLPSQQQPGRADMGELSPCPHLNPPTLSSITDPGVLRGFYSSAQCRRHQSQKQPHTFPAADILPSIRPFYQSQWGQLSFVQ